MFLLRQILGLLALIGLAWAVRRLFGERRRPVPPGAKRSVPASRDGVMVRDRICNTFLPESSALKASVDGQEHFFCSERCRQRFLTER